MTYRISGLEPSAFAHLVGRDDTVLAAHGARRVIATSDHGFPCRISLEDARAGERLILLHHVSHDTANPYRSAFAIFIREAAEAAAVYDDEVPPVFAGRPIALRGFDLGGDLRDALLALPGEAAAKIRRLLDDPAIAYIHAHNAAHGCFAAEVERHDRP